ncbi:MAG: hypothetical protein ACPHID_02075 [Thermoplasmatota archaeon]
MLRLLTILLIVPFSGCLGADDTEGAAPPVQPVDAFANRWLFDGCEGFTVVQTFPTALHPAPVPTGFDPSPELAVVTQNVVLALQCERIGIAGYERPAFILLEFADNAVAPAACRDDSAGRLMWALHRAWSNDTEVAEFFGSLGLQTKIVDPTVAPDDLGQARWQWVDADMRLFDDDTWTSFAQPLGRFVWIGDGQSHILDWELTGSRPGSRMAFGQIGDTFGQPMAQPTAWSGGRLTGMFGGELQSFASSDCSSS